MIIFKLGDLTAELVDRNRNSPVDCSNIDRAGKDATVWREDAENLCCAWLGVGRSARGVGRSGAAAGTGAADRTAVE